MVLYVYVYRLNYGRGRPTWLWVRRSRWLFLRWEDSERFRSVLTKLEGWSFPKVPLGREGREDRVKAYLVLKIDEIREFLRFAVSDLLHDAYISKDRLRSLEEMGWDVEAYKPTPELLALWKVGLESTGLSRLSEVREKFHKLVDALSKGGNDEE